MYRSIFKIYEVNKLMKYRNVRNLTFRKATCIHFVPLGSVLQGGGEGEGGGRGGGRMTERATVMLAGNNRSPPCVFVLARMSPLKSYA
jgi:hypothetical protein